MEEKHFDIMNIKSPEFLKQLNINELKTLCEDIRKFIIENVSKTGGHLASSLGAVEAIVAMHYVFDSPKDKFLFDVSHQAYAHKILTGRSAEFSHLRQKDGISGFTKYDESIHDVYESGHSSSSISFGTGLLEAKEVNNEIGDVIAFIGDGSIQNGLAFEGLNYLGSQKNQKMIIVINDNDMSISKNVGRLAKSFSKIRIKRSYHLLKKVTPRFVKAILSRSVASTRAFIYGGSGNIFISMGYRYLGPIDGHDLNELIKFFSFAKKTPQSVILHINTIKGKGYDPAQNDNTGIWHGVGAFDIKTGELISNKPNNLVSYSKVVSHIMDEEIKNHSNIRLISPATLVGTSMEDLHAKYSDNVIDVGINEEQALVMSASMGRNGIIPVVSIYSTFLQRAYDYINNDIARVNTHCVLLIDRSGIVPQDGSTHQGIFDLSFLSSLPNMQVLMPSNIDEAYSLIDYAINSNKPVAVRVTKCDTLIDKDLNDYSLNSIEIIDKPYWKIINPIKDINIITYGEFVNEYKENSEYGLINALFIKPIDLDCLRRLSGKTVIVLEEVIKNGSLGSMILEANSKYDLNIRIKTLGIDDSYPSVGTRKELLKEFKLDKEDVIEFINNLK